jgi:hypothetical protein
MPTRLAFALLFVCSCVSRGGDFPPPQPAPAGPSPDKAAGEKTTQKQEDEKLLKEKKISTEPAALLGYFKKRTLDTKALDSAADLVKKLGDDDYFVREKATEDLRKGGGGLVPLLRAALTSPDEEIKDRARMLLLTLESNTNPAVTLAVLRLLRSQPPDGTALVLFDYLPVADNESVQDEVLGLLATLGVKDGKVSRFLEDALKDRQPMRRAAAGMVLGRSGSAEQKKAAQALLTDADANVRFHAAQGLLAGKDRAGVPVLCALIGDGPMALGTRAEDLLQCLAGAQPPQTPPFAEDANARKKSRKIWEDWWKQNNKMDLTRVEIDIPPFNLALQAREVIRRFGTAVMINDVDTMKKQVDAPFMTYGNQTLSNKNDVIQYIESNNVPGRNQQGTVVILGLAALDKVPANEKKFVTDLKKDVRAFNVYFMNNPNINPNPGEECTLYVRVSGDQAKLVGFGQPRQRAVAPNMLDRN